MLKELVKDRDIGSYIDDLWKRIRTKVTPRGFGPRNIEGIIQKVTTKKGSRWLTQLSSVPFSLAADLGRSWIYGSPPTLVFAFPMPIIDEYVAILQRLGSQNERELSELLGLFARGHHIDFCARRPQLYVVEEDADDNKFIECAVVLKADYVISGDKSILGVREYMDISIVTPKDFLDTCMGHYS